MSQGLAIVGRWTAAAIAQHSSMADGTVLVDWNGVGGDHNVYMLSYESMQLFGSRGAWVIGNLPGKPAGTSFPVETTVENVMKAYFDQTELDCDDGVETKESEETTEWRFTITERHRTPTAEGRKTEKRVEDDVNDKGHPHGPDAPDAASSGKTAA